MLPSVLVLSDFNIGVFERLLRHDVEPPIVSVEAAPFDQVFAELTAGPARPDTVGVVWVRPEGALPSFRRALVEGDPLGDELAAEVDDYAHLLRAFAGRHRHVLVATFAAPPAHRGLGMLDWRPGTGLRHAVANANVRLAAALDDVANIHLLDAEDWLRAGGPQAGSPKQWFTSKVPYVNAVFDAAVADVKAAMRGVAGQARKLVVVDLDDTLWGGVVGDVGWQALRLGGHDHLGEAFQDFQRALKALRQRGVLLGAVSKNSEAVALEAIASHPEMVLGLDDLAGWRVDWNDKAANVASLVAELNLGLDAVVFIDDNPAERSRVREALPDVLVPEWPRDPTQFASALRSLRCFDAPTISDEDRNRTASYATERARRAGVADVGSLDEWLARLELRVVVAPLDAANLPRVVQLLNKTNQMNLTTRRTTEPALLAWSEQPGHHLVALSVEDRFGPDGLTGVLGLAVRGDEAHATDLVLSCRVMGRKIEEAMLHLASACAQRLGASTLVLRHLPTDRNGPCLDVLRASALEEVEPHTFVWRSGSPYPNPPFIELVDADRAPGALT